MDAKKVTDALNKAIAFEHTASLQYKQQALLVSGFWRKVFADFFMSHSKGSLEHAEKFGRKVVALGGMPTVEVGAVQQSADLEEMLRQDLALERETLDSYITAHKLAEGDIALRTMLESHIESEQRDIEELEMYLDMTSAKGGEHGMKMKRVK